MSEADGACGAVEDSGTNTRGQIRYPPALTARGRLIYLSMTALSEMGEPERVTVYEAADGRIGIAPGGDGPTSRSVTSVPDRGGQMGYVDLARRLTDGSGRTRYRLTHDPDAGLWVLDPEEPWEPGDGDE